MKSITKKSIAIFLVVMSIVSLFAFNTSAVGALSFSVDDYGYAKVESCDPNAKGTVVVPSTVKINGTEYTVTIIGDNAFANCLDVETITIQEGVNQIGSKAFENCISLKTVDVPKTLISCQYDAFDGCGEVTVNCYSSNTQFFAVYGFSNNIKLNIVDSDMDTSETQTLNFILEIVKKLVAFILGLFGIDITK